MNFPIFSKPRFRGRASLGVRTIETPAELEARRNETPEAVFSELLVGVEHTVDVLSDFDGKPRGGVVRQRSETKSGVSTKGVTLDDRELLGQAFAIAAELGLRGPSNIQCFKNARGNFFFEVNPRFSGTLSLSIAAGFNSPLLLAKLALGLPLEEREVAYRPGVAMMRYWQEVFVGPRGEALSSLELAP